MNVCRQGDNEVLTIESHGYSSSVATARVDRNALLCQLSGRCGDGQGREGDGGDVEGELAEHVDDLISGVSG